MLPAEHLRKVVDWARERGAVVASDECYLALGWDAAPRLGAAPGRSAAATTPACSRCTRCRKSSNLAGYRAGFVAGDPALVAALLEVRKHAGMIVPAPGAGGDGGRRSATTRTWSAQAAGYAARRARLRAGAGGGGLHDRALRGRALPVGHRRASRAATIVRRLAELGILVAPGEFYGPAGARHVRVALTATDERIARGAGPAARADRSRTRAPAGPDVRRSTA